MDPTEIVEIYATCSPFIVTVGGEPVVILEVKRNADCCYTTSLVGLKARTGEQVWIGPRMGSHFTSALAGDVVVTTAFDMSKHYSHPMELIALKFHWEGKALKSQTVWRTTGSLGGNRYRMTSPLATNGRVYSGFGPLRCFDLATGKVLWAVKDVDSGGWGLSSPVLADGKVFVVSDKGTLHVVKDEGAAGKLLLTQNVCGHIGATPALADGKLILRDYEHGVFCYELKPSSPAAPVVKTD
jgi:outer membrane protein assembly factor BamB